MAEKRNYKDNLFVSIFGRSVNSKEYFLSLYNAIHGTDFKIGEVTIEPVTLENVVYRGLNNDVSMMINDTIIILAEQQSTINNNMAFRCLEYIVAQYSRIFERHEKYHSKQIKLPRPECYVFYNGDAPFPLEKEMRLSEAFKELPKNKNGTKNLPESLNLDLTVKIFNINYKENHPILEKCLALFAYSKFNEYVRIGKSDGRENPIGYALDRCVSENVLADYFNNLRKEDMSLIFGEWDEEMFVKVQREEAYEDGQAAKAIENARNLLKETELSPEKIAQCCSLPLEQVLALQESLKAESFSDA